MNGLINWAVSRARMIFAFVVLSVVAGLTAYTSLPNEGDPQIDIPVLYVSTGVPGASAADMESLVVKPMETELKGLSGVKEMTSYASRGHAGIVLQFDFDWDKTSTLADARDRVNRAKADLPDDATEPRIIEMSTAEIPVIVVTISGDAPERTLLRVAKDAQRRIEALKPISEATMSGQREEVVEVIVDPLKMEAYGLTAEELITVVRRNNQLVTAGSVKDDTGSFSITMPGKLENPQDIYSIVVKRSGDRTVTVAEIAELKRTFKDRESYARFNGEPAIALRVKKRAGESTVETVASVREVLEQARAEWPEALRDTVRLSFSFDRSEEADRMAKQLEGSVLTAVLLVMMVLFATLGFRSALLVGFAVPCSFLLTFALLGGMGMSINSMVLFGLILAVGMLVDGAIVVAEYADRRLSEGAEPVAAYAEAARRMAWPVVSSTATTLCAFLPMLLWPGGPGEWMSRLPVTIIFVLSASLLVALIYLPVIGGTIASAAARVGRAFAALSGRKRETEDAAIVAPEDMPMGRTLFGRIVGRTVRSAWLSLLAILLAVGTLIGTGWAYGQYGQGAVFFADTIAERASVFVRARGNLSVDETDRALRQVEAIALETPGVASVFASTGQSNGGGFGFGGGPEDTVGSVRIEFDQWDELLTRDEPTTGDEILAKILARAQEIPGIFVEQAVEKPGPQSGKPIQLELTALSGEQLEAAVVAVRKYFEADPELIDIEDSRSLPGIEWLLTVDRRAAGRFGADLANLGAMVALATRGYTLDTMTPPDSEDEIDIVARFPASDRSLGTLDSLRIQTTLGLAPVSNFVIREPAPLVGEIVRKDGRLFMSVAADVVEGVNVNDKVAAITTWLTEQAAQNPLAWAGVGAEFGGDQEEQEESGAFLIQAFMGALGLMFVILLAQFNSLYESVLVLSAVIMSLAGVLLGLLIMGQPFSIIMTGVGVVALAGIVVNNNIVLIDTFQDYRRTMDPIDAVARTVEDRLRPVMLTTSTTIAGLLPMMFAASIDIYNLKFVTGAPSAIWWVPLATAVVFGLGFSTLLTLVVTPSALALRIWIGRALTGAYRRAVRSAATERSAQTRPMQPAAPSASSTPSAKPDGLAPAE